ncbi:hypothetical protein BDF22DRAFT_386892 [Syncephalis plumigaleata]|nr:hypothetical protein BDF22DRAFT_386892 [Syncephalis plumigaleata]
MQENISSAMLPPLDSDPATAVHPMVADILANAFNSDDVMANAFNSDDVIANALSNNSDLFVNEMTMHQTEQVSSESMIPPAVQITTEIEEDVEIEEEIVEEDIDHHQHQHHDQHLHHIEEEDDEEVEMEEEVVMVDPMDAVAEDTVASQISRLLDEDDANRSRTDADTSLTSFPRTINGDMWTELYAREETQDTDDTEGFLDTLQVPQERSSSRVSMTAELSAADRSTSRGSNRSRLGSENNSRTASPALEANITVDVVSEGKSTSNDCLVHLDHLDHYRILTDVILFIHTINTLRRIIVPFHLCQEPCW